MGTRGHSIVGQGFNINNLQLPIDVTKPTPQKEEKASADPLASLFPEGLFNTRKKGRPKKKQPDLVAGILQSHQPHQQASPSIAAIEEAVEEVVPTEKQLEKKRQQKMKAIEDALNATEKPNNKKKPRNEKLGAGLKFI